MEALTLAEDTITCHRGSSPEARAPGIGIADGGAGGVLAPPSSRPSGRCIVTLQASTARQLLVRVPQSPRRSEAKGQGWLKSLEGPELILQ
jgi:hypothetical protein